MNETGSNNIKTPRFPIECTQIPSQNKNQTSKSSVGPPRVPTRGSRRGRHACGPKQRRVTHNGREPGGGGEAPGGRHWAAGARNAGRLHVAGGIWGPVGALLGCHNADRERAASCGAKINEVHTTSAHHASDRGGGKRKGGWPATPCVPRGRHGNGRSLSLFTASIFPKVKRSHAVCAPDLARRQPFGAKP
jgi:hypothetical protein